MRTIQIAFVAFLLTSCATTPPISDKPLSVIDLSTAVENAWAKWSAQRTESNIASTKLKSVSLTTQIKESSSTESGVSVLVLSAKAKREVVTSRSITLKLAAPNRLTAWSTPVLDSELLLAFRQADAITSEMLRSGGRLVLDDVGVSIGFDVIESASGGFTLELGSIKLGPSASSSVSGTHKIDLVFNHK